MTKLEIEMIKVMKEAGMRVAKTVNRVLDTNYTFHMEDYRQSRNGDWFIYMVNQVDLSEVGLWGLAVKQMSIKLNGKLFLKNGTYGNSMIFTVEFRYDHHNGGSNGCPVSNPRNGNPLKIEYFFHDNSIEVH